MVKDNRNINMGGKKRCTLNHPASPSRGFRFLQAHQTDRAFALERQHSSFTQPQGVSCKENVNDVRLCDWLKPTKPNLPDLNPAEDFCCISLYVSFPAISLLLLLSCERWRKRLTWCPTLLLWAMHHGCHCWSICLSVQWSSTLVQTQIFRADAPPNLL